jgi:hypothetical protein
VLILRGACYFQSFLFPYFWVLPISCLFFLLAQKGLFFHESSWLTLISSSICKIPLSIFCSAGLVTTNYFNFSLLWKVLISPSIRKDNFPGWTSLGWHFLFLRTWIMSFPDLLAFRVWVVKSATIIMDLPLYVTCLLSFAAFRILSLFCALSVLIMRHLGVFLLWSSQFGVL